MILEKENLKIHHNIDNVVISNGAKHSLSNVLFSILEKGDEVLLPVPYWTSYKKVSELLEAKCILVDTEKNNFKLTAKTVEKYITKKTKVLFLNSPNNPTGKVIEQEELENIIYLALKNKFYIISDEVYKDIYTTKESFSISKAKNYSEAKDQIIIINSFSKNYGLSGLRIGYLIANKNICESVKSLQSNTTSNPNTISQYIIMEILKKKYKINQKLNKKIKRIKKYVINELKTVKNIEIVSNFEYGIYILIKTKENSNFLCKEILKEKKIALMPGEVFGLKKYIRISCVEDYKIIKKAIKLIKEFFLERY